MMQAESSTIKKVHDCFKVEIPCCKLSFGKKRFHVSLRYVSDDNVCVYNLHDKR